MIGPDKKEIVCVTFVTVTITDIDKNMITVCKNICETAVRLDMLYDAMSQFCPSLQKGGLSRGGGTGVLGCNTLKD